MTAREIIAMIATRHRIEYSELIREGVHERGRKTGNPEAAAAKAEAAWELRARLNLSYPAVARALQLRSHATAIYLCRRHAGMNSGCARARQAA